MVPRTGGPVGLLPKTSLLTSYPGEAVPNRFPTYTPSPALLHLHEGEDTLGIAHYRLCDGKSYSRLIQLTSEVAVNAIHCNGRHPSIDGDEQLVIRMMTTFLLAHPEDLKLLLREGIEKLCPPGIVTREYNSLQFATAKGETGTQGRYLLVGLSTLSQTHLRLRDILLSQPEAVHESHIQTLPWLAPL